MKENEINEWKWSEKTREGNEQKMNWNERKWKEMTGDEETEGIEKKWKEMERTYRKSQQMCGNELS